MGKDPGSSYCQEQGLSSSLTVIVVVIERRYLGFGQSYSSSVYLVQSYGKEIGASYSLL